MKISVEACDVWEYFLDHKSRLEEGYKHMIAENADIGVKIWIGSEVGILSISIECDGEEIDSLYLTKKEDVEETIDIIYDEYLTVNAFKTLGIYEDEAESKIDDRECDLEFAVLDFLTAVCDEDYSKNTTMLNDITDHFLEYIARKWALPVYRPMMLEDVDTGEEYYTEYPYDEMVYDDEDNPIYKIG